MRILRATKYILLLIIFSCSNNILYERSSANRNDISTEMNYIDSLSIGSPLMNMTTQVVLGGQEADDQLSSMNVYLESEKGSCSGTVIARDIILTAAHCIHSTTNEIRVYFNNNFDFSLTSTKFSKLINYLEEDAVDEAAQQRYSGEHLDFDLARYQSFQQYFDSLTEISWRPLDQDNFVESFDLALVYLEEELPAGVNIANFFSGDLSFRQELIGAGYGVTSRNYNERSNNNLRYTTMKLFAGYYYNNQAVSIRVHSGHYSKNTCAGDSGGGLWHKDNEGNYRLLGVLSSGTNNCANSKVYPLIHPNYDWIEREVLKFRSEAAL